jgi:spectinomycin phosphotransferase
MLDKPGIPEELLRACLRDRYDLVPVSLDVLPLGQDTRAFVCRVVSEQGTDCLLKARFGPFYEPGCLVPGYLREEDIAPVVAPLPTKSKTLWTRIGDWTVVLYPYIEGVTGWPGMTDEHWRRAGAVFKQIHQVRVPPLGFASLRKERFDPTEYVRWVREFEAQHVYVEGGPAPERALRACWMTYQSTIHHAVRALENLAGVLQKRPGPYVICHTDLHPGNLIRDHTGRVFVIDWDEVMLAPKERDFLFVGEPLTDGSNDAGSSPFFQGYGQAEIDWTALTYYRYERVVQDVIEYAQNVFFRDDLGETIKEHAVRSFQINLAEGRMLIAARIAAAHLPSVGGWR